MIGPGLIVPVERVQRSILVLRGQRVILDGDLAKLYAVTTKRLNEQVRRNRERFPEDFMFQLTPDEKAEVVANCDHLSRLKFSPALPHAFTEHGAIMAASVLNTLPPIGRRGRSGSRSVRNLQRTGLPGDGSR